MKGKCNRNYPTKALLIIVLFISTVTMNCSFNKKPKILLAFSLLQNSATTQFIISGTVTGLTGSNLILQNNGLDTISISSNGSFSFPTKLNENATYSVSILTNPSSPSQSCIVANGTGTVVGSNITNIVVTCSPSVFTYSSTSYILRTNVAITSITPTITGSVTSCTTNPTLPTGLSINNLTCAITGTPTANQSSTSYTITASNAGANTTVSISITIQSNIYKIFITALTYNGDLMTAGAGANGAAGADNLCNADINKPNASNYKALVMDSVNRTAVPSYINWVLLPNTTYIRAADSATIFTTNASSIFTFGTLTNSMGTGSQQEYWTGFQQGGTDWATSTQRCTNWTNGTVATARYGLSNTITYESFAFVTSSTCSNLKHILCAEQ